MIWAKLESIKLKKTDTQHLDVLKSCPFCGHGAEYRGTVEGAALRTFFVQCTNCLNSTDLFTRPTLAADRWNRRI